MTCSIVGNRQGEYIATDYNQSKYGHFNYNAAAGPHCNVVGMEDVRIAAHDDNTIKPTSSSQGPSRIKQTISPASSCQNFKQGGVSMSRSSRNSGFRPINSLQNSDN
jgi:hypothetical protein